MRNKMKHGIGILLIGFISPINAKNNIEISGFARLVGGALDSDNVSYLDYDNNLSFDNDSLVALQASGSFNKSWSATAQAIYHSGPHRESGIEWAYLTYHYNNKLKIKAGKLRTPFFNYSDVIDVGFAYPWVTPPKQVYQPFLFSNFLGANVSYNFTHNDIGYDVEAYWGKFDDNLYVNGDDFKTEVDDLRGIVAKINIKNLTVRFSYHKGYVSFEQQELQQLATSLKASGFTKSADSIANYGNIQAIQAGLSYDALDYFARFEIMKLDGDVLAFPDTSGYFGTIGYNFFPFTIHYTYADHNSDYNSPINEIPIGVNPQLNFLYESYVDVFNYLNTNDVQSNTIGMRWDYSQQIAFKLDISKLQGQLVNQTLDAPSSEKEQATLIKAGVEWVF